MIAGSWCIGTTIRSDSSPRSSSARTSSSSSGVPIITCAPVSPTRLSVRRVVAYASSRSASVHFGTTALTRSMAAFSSSAPVGRPSASTTISADSPNFRAPLIPASASAVCDASAVCPSKK